MLSRMILRLVAWGVRHPKAFDLIGLVVIAGLIVALTFHGSFWHNVVVIALVVICLCFGATTIVLIAIGNQIEDSKDHPYIARLMWASWIKNGAEKKMDKEK